MNMLNAFLKYNRDKYIPVWNQSCNMIDAIVESTRTEDEALAIFLETRKPEWRVRNEMGNISLLRMELHDKFPGLSNRIKYLR